MGSMGEVHWTVKRLWDDAIERSGATVQSHHPRLSSSCLWHRHNRCWDWRRDRRRYRRSAKFCRQAQHAPASCLALCKCSIFDGGSAAKCEACNFNVVGLACGNSKHYLRLERGVVVVASQSGERAARAAKHRQHSVIGATKGFDCQRTCRWRN